VSLAQAPLGSTLRPAAARLVVSFASWMTVTCVQPLPLRSPFARLVKGCFEIAG
jgi:hypothetical protein